MIGINTQFEDRTGRISYELEEGFEGKKGIWVIPSWGRCGVSLLGGRL